MTTSSSSRPPRRTALRALAVAVAVVGSTLPTWNASATGGPHSGPGTTAAATPTYTLTIHHLGRDGQVAPRYKTQITEFAGQGNTEVLTPTDTSGTTTVRLPKGRYLLSSMLHGKTNAEGTDWVVQPRLDLNRDTSLTIDSRTTKPVDVRPQDDSAEHVSGTMFVAAEHDGATRYANVIVATPTLRVAHRGPAAEAGSVQRWYDVYWHGKQHRYALGDVSTGDRALTGLVRHPADKDLAEVKIRGAAHPGSDGMAVLDVTPSTRDTAGSYVAAMPAPGTVSFLFSPQRGKYNIGYTNPRTEEEGPSSWYEVRNVSPRLGRSLTHTFDNGVFGPKLDGSPGVTRTGNRIAVDVPLLADGDGHQPFEQPYDTASTTLYRNGQKVKTVTGKPGRATFDVPTGRANYRVTATVRRTGQRGAATTVTASWTFASQRTAAAAKLPVSVVRFAPALGLDGTAPAGKALRVPVSVQGPARGHVRALDVAYSVNGGTSWQRAAVVGGVATVPAQKAGTAVTLRAKLTDTAGNTLTQTAVSAYRTR
ncbi:serine protease [Streptomyces sp. 796.1]|uniref:serine protease n=1 Tax=Streptomyces sp. 796.1 TaxID=3163029 RepID=UPI0039C9BF17